MERVTGTKLQGYAKNGLMHLINSGATALDATGAARDENGRGCMKEWWNMTDADISACLENSDWCRADYEYFRGGGFSSHFKTLAEMPVTMARLCLVDGIGPVMQIAEGYTCVLDEKHMNCWIDVPILPGLPHGSLPGLRERARLRMCIR